MMTLEMKSNLAQIFRQPEPRLNLGQVDRNEQAIAHKPFSLRAAATPFVVDNKFALQLDEII
ncbi:hypothetical protein [Polynucleobacter sp. AM-25C3]|jgi:hypothetical protein|uniref:hypothetical protein n=1 Tax=Polynucleobacter sp. AM-25C3 TaxID=1855569 RepID=UPI001C0B6399|nr:hypothetical protein [Polynucleobacter sp. AM-25C3]MBU3601078.1 hypothetical protein [Polynucleobacter sp. AM-25C3]